MEINYRKLIDAGLASLNHKKEELANVQSEIEELQNSVGSLKKIHSIFKEGAVISQTFLSEYLENLVTDAISVVFPDHNTKFKVQFVTSRDTQCILSMEENGKKLTLFNSDGYGALDIVSIALHAAYIILDGSEKIMILDEPFRHLSVDRHELAAKMLKGLSHKLGIQMIINTHLQYIDEIADNVIRVSYDHKNKCSIINGIKHEIKMAPRTNRKHILQKGGDHGKKSKNARMQPGKRVRWRKSIVPS